MTTDHSTKNHPYHVIEPSCVPLFSAFATFLLLVGTALLFKHHKYGEEFMFAGVVTVIVSMYLWWSDVVKEAIVDKAHNKIVQHGLRIGMALFILSEVMFFAVFFWSIIRANVDPVGVLEAGNPFAGNPIPFPPKNVLPIDPFDLPFLNTLILLLSGTTVTWAHHALYQNDRKSMVRALLATVVLGVMFTTFQVIEYVEAVHHHFGFVDGGNYSSNFYIATGFHGAHVMVGTIFLLICLLRAKKGHFTKSHHLGFEFAAWYWHFVDVVWLLLFTFVYVLGR